MKEKHYDDLDLTDKDKYEELNNLFDLDSLFKDEEQDDEQTEEKKDK